MDLEYRLFAYWYECYEERQQCSIDWKHIRGLLFNIMKGINIIVQNELNVI